MNDSTLKSCVVGVGSPHGNDAVGWRVADELRASVSESVEVFQVREPTQLLSLPGNYTRVWIVDACRSSQPPGTISHIAWPNDQIGRNWALSGHGVNLAEVLELGTTLGRLPDETILYTVDIGDAPSAADREFCPEVNAAVKVLVDQLSDEIVAKVGGPQRDFAQTAAHCSATSDQPSAGIRREILRRNSPDAGS